VALRPNSGPDARGALLWRSSQLVAIYCPHNTQYAYETIIPTLSGTRNRDPINWAAAELHPRPHGHRDRPSVIFVRSEVSRFSKSGSTSHFQ
jgi:hypothetical protein